MIATADLKWLSDEEWQRKTAAIRKEGRVYAKKMHRRGRPFQAKILSPKEASKSGFAVSIVVIQHDWKAKKKLAMGEDANNFLTKALEIGAYDNALPVALGAVIEGKGLYEYSMGEFFLLYGRFEQKYNVRKGPEVEAKMNDLLQGNEQGLRDYVSEGGKTKRVPLPYAVRNILAHAGHNPNKTAADELQVAVKLLRSWVGD